ncbi:MAG: hypothetical protein RJA70_163 [Pseudomonadota bacterium]|jgi:poly-gamma-glutamate system protein
MKPLYWRASKVSRIELLLVALVATISVAVVENLPRVVQQPYYNQKLSAARLAERCQIAIREEKQRRGLPIDPESDPHNTGMIGSSVSKITSNTGHLPSKLLSTNPNFAAVMVDLLKQAGVTDGSTVAVGLSGSFPAMNIALFSALEVLGAEAIVIASASASQWGATDISYTWLDMEQTLVSRGLLGFRTFAASRGGIDDRGFGIARDGRQLLDEAIERAKVRRLSPKSLGEAIDTRMTLFHEQSKGAHIAAYVNIGGGSASVGTVVGKKLFTPGINTVAPKGATDSVMLRFVEDGVPVIHISGIKRLARRFDLPVAMLAPPRVGEGGVYDKTEYNTWFAALGLIATLGTMFVLLKLDLRQAVVLLRKKPAPEPQNTAAQRGPGSNTPSS